MGRALALILIAILAACLSLALAFQAFTMGAWLPCVILVVSGVSLVVACVNLVGGSLYRSLADEVGKAGKEVRLSDETIDAKHRRGLVALLVGAILLAVGLALGGSPLIRFTLGLLAL